MVRKYSGYSKLAMTCFHWFEIKSDWCRVTDLIKQVFNAGWPFKNSCKASFFLLKHTVLSVFPVDNTIKQLHLLSRYSAKKKWKHAQNDGSASFSYTCKCLTSSLSIFMSCKLKAQQNGIIVSPQRFLFMCFDLYEEWEQWKKRKRYLRGCGIKEILTAISQFVFICCFHLLE